MSTENTPTLMQRPIGRRQFLRGAAAMAGVGLLAACVPAPAPTEAPEEVPEEEAEAPEEQPAEPEKLTLRFTIVAGEDEMPGWEGITNAWNEDSDEVFVKLERLPGGWDDYIQKMVAQIAAGDPPDIGRMGVAFMAAFIENQQILDLGQLGDRDAFPYDEYYESAFGPYRIGSSLWGMPIGIYTMANWVNKTLFQEAGIELPGMDWNNTWDWAEFRDKAKGLTSGEGAGKTYGLFINYHPERSLQYVWQNGGTFLNADKTKCTFNELAAVEAMQFLQDIMWEDMAAPQPAQVQTLPLTDMFQTGRLAMYQEGQWMTGYMRTITDFEWGVTPFPKQAAAATEIYVDGYVVFKGAEDHIEQAWQVIKSFVGEKAENILVDTALAGIPVLKRVAEARVGDMFNPLPPEEKQVWIDSISVARTPPFTANWRELMEAATAELDLVGLNEKSAAEACDAIAEKVDALLA